MRIARAVALLSLVLSAALVLAQPRAESKPDAKSDAKPGMKSDPMPGITSVTEVEGKTLDQWTKDLTHPDPSVREKAISIIPVYGPSATHTVRLMVERCKDSDLGPRVKAVMALGVMDMEERDAPLVIGTLANILSDDPQHAAKFQAAISLARFSEEAKIAIPALISGTGDTGSWQIRKASILALRRVGSDKKKGPDPRATRALLFATKDPAYQVRLEAVQGLGYMDKPEDPALRLTVFNALKLLVSADRGSASSTNERVLAMWAHVSLMALDKVTDTELQQVAKNLSSSELEVRGQAVLAIGTLGTKAKPLIPDLVRMLEDKDMGIVVTSAWALVSVGEKEAKAMNALTELSERKDLDERVREQIFMALHELKTSKKSDLPPNVKENKP